MHRRNLDVHHSDEYAAVGREAQGPRPGPAFGSPRICASGGAAGKINGTTYVPLSATYDSASSAASRRALVASMQVVACWPPMFKGQHRSRRWIAGLLVRVRGGHSQAARGAACPRTGLRRSLVLMAACAAMLAATSAANVPNALSNSAKLPISTRRHYRHASVAEGTK